MKKFTVIVAFILAVSSCKVPVYTIGMSETEFRSQHKLTAQVVEQTANHAVYKIQTSFQDEKKKRYQFFYFENGKLVRLDEGQAMYGI